jgi:hypothetical protein
MSSIEVREPQRWLGAFWRTKARNLIIAAAAGVLLGFTAWQVGQAPLVAILFPVLIPLMPGRVGVFVYAAGYHMGCVYGLMEFAANWFEGDYLVGMLSWVGLSLSAAVAWAALNSGTRCRSVLACGSLVGAAFVLALLPPFANVTPGHPLVAWGFVLRGFGFLGVLLALLSTSALVILVAWLRGRPRVGPKLTLGVSALFGALVAASVMMPNQNFDVPAGVVALDTFYGAPPANDDLYVERLARVQSDLRRAMRPGGVAHEAQVIVLPENTLSVEDPAFDYAIKTFLIKPIQRADKAVVVGKIKATNDGLRNQAALIYEGSQLQAVDQRQPAMMSMWRPWANEHYSLDWFRESGIRLPDGRTARVVICYEEYIPAIYLIDELRGGHSLTIFMSSSWAASRWRLTEVQRLHAVGMSMLFGRAAVRAVNYSPK